CTRDRDCIGGVCHVLDYYGLDSW
nr:immunoglobulin heavy chain junction region [Macaca mulatta]MOY18064.1 immunoglobulin heavy chain junction region [Macaca mulatta]MOY18135.1 immunoglobulin heavy chain junction region [Macaca mulatta]MOY18465.1 immunoglobulin heavy chain junction region [Macaca mulatta]MOY18479.1 immunoglobulin heavy chain junction region [Macaca mulatta]